MFNIERNGIEWRIWILIHYWTLVIETTCRRIIIFVLGLENTDFSGLCLLGVGAKDLQYWRNRSVRMIMKHYLRHAHGNNGRDRNLSLLRCALTFDTTDILSSYEGWCPFLRYISIYMTHFLGHRLGRIIFDNYIIDVNMNWSRISRTSWRFWVLVGYDLSNLCTPSLKDKAILGLTYF